MSPGVHQEFTVHVVQLEFTSVYVPHPSPRRLGSGRHWQALAGTGLHGLHWPPIHLDETLTRKSYTGIRDASFHY